MTRASDPAILRPGDFYEDCRYHPMVCVEVKEGEDVVGISLVTGDVGSCSLDHCGVVKLSPQEAIERRLGWDTFVEGHGLTEYRSSHYPRANPPRA